MAVITVGLWYSLVMVHCVIPRWTNDEKTMVYTV